MSAAPRNISFSNLLDEFLKKSAEIISDYSTVMNSISGRPLFLIPPLPIVTEEVKRKMIIKDEKSNTEENNIVPLTQEENDNIIIKSASRTSLELHAESFLKNLKRKLPGISRKGVEKRVEELSNEGKLKRKDE